MARRKPAVRKSIFDMPLSSASNKESRKSTDDAFNEDGNFKDDLPTTMSACIDEEGNPTLVATPLPESPNRLNSFPFRADSANGNESPETKPLSVLIPTLDVMPSPQPMERDSEMDPGTSTEEEFLEEEFESELLAEERREQAQSLRKKKSREILTAKNRWWALAKAGRTKSFLWVLLRWPLLIAFCLFISVDLTCYVAVRQWVRWYEWAITWRGKRRRLRQDLNDATTYEEYKVCARKLDEFLGNSRWKNEEICPHYDVDLVHRTVRRLRRHRSIIASALRRKGETSSVTSAARSNATAGIMKVLQHGACKHNFGGIENEALYSHTYLGTKKLVEEFVHEICQSLMHVAESTDLTSDEKHDFFKKVSQNYGRTALCLSGGATLGYYHGVVKSLYEEKLLPNIITGTSAGSLIAALICCRTDQELVDEVFVPSIHKILTACDVPYMERAKRMYKTGAMFDHREWYQKVMLATKGPLTFWEAYQRTGRVLNIAIVPDEPHSPFKLCNYITTPNVVVATAVMASSAVPGVLNPVELLIKTETGQLVPFHGSGRKWRDGSLMMDIPERELHRLWNVNFTIVSQVNPHIVLFFFDKRGSAGSPTAHRYGQGWRGGFIASALVQHFKLDLQKWMTLLKDFELLPRVLGSDVSDVFLQRFEGDVTIVPRATLEDYRMILTDPTNERMKRYIERGEARTWPKLHMIANRLAIEKTLSKCRRMFPDSGNAKLGSAHGRRGSRYSNTWSAVSRSPRWLTTIEDTAVPAETLEPLDISQTE